MSTWAPDPSAGTRLVNTNFSTVRSAGTYDILTATGDVFILDYEIKTGAASTGLTSLTVQSNNTTPLVMLSSKLLAALTGDKSLISSGTGFLLENTKRIQSTIVGTGTGTGTLIVTATYVPVTAGATLA